MTHEQAKRTLALYRPWAGDAGNSAFTESLVLAQADAELSEWFARHCATQSAIRSQFTAIPIPAGLKEQIISEHRAQLNQARRKNFIRPLALAAVIALLAIAGTWLWEYSATRSDLSYEAYRVRMVKTARRNYGMDLETSDAAAIRNYLGKHQAYANYQLPEPLAEAAYTGCGVLSWQGHRVSMVCFHSGKPLPAGEKTDLFLFVLPDNAAKGAPTTQAPTLVRTSDTATASWKQDGLVYLLATTGDEELLKRYLQGLH